MPIHAHSVAKDVPQPLDVNAVFSGVHGFPVGAQYGVSDGAFEMFLFIKDQFF